MTNIDTAIAALLASSVDSLSSIASRSNASTAQTGTSALSVDTPSLANGTAVSLLDNQPQASAQTILSRVALTLDAIMRSGGDATPSLVGQWPIWPVVPSLDNADAALAEGANAENAANPDEAAAADANAAGNAAAATASGASSASGTSGTSGTSGAQAGAAQGAAGAALAAASLPVDVLAEALRQTVDESGLFYEAHLAQWLSGQRAPDTLGDEPQNRLVAEAVQLPLDWALAEDATTDGEGLASWWHGGSAQPGSAAQPNAGAPQANALPFSTRFAAAVQEFAEDAFGGGASPQSARGGTQAAFGNNSANSSANASQASAQASQYPAQAMAASVHPATVTLVRQQLDLLATGEFRWSGEAWPGARFDWTIEEGGERWSRGGHDDSFDPDAARPWCTRLTLSLPVLGTVDAALTLTGSQLTARVQASPHGAARLAAQGESFRQRLAAIGIALTALSVREIAGGGPAGYSGVAGRPHGTPSMQAAAQAYARAAAAASARGEAGMPGTWSTPGQMHGGHRADAAPFDLFDGDDLL